MSLTIGKSRNVPNVGLSITVAAPVSEISRIQFNNDNTMTVLVEFWENQAAFDDPTISPYDMVSYIVPVPVALFNLINTELKNLPDFDVAT